MDKLAEKQVLNSNATTNAMWGFAPWVVVFCATTFGFYQFILLTMFNALNEPLLKEFHITASTIGQMASMYIIGNILLLIPAGILIDRYSTRKIILITMSISVLSTFLFAVAPTPLIAMIARFLMGLSGAFNFLAVVRLATQWFLARKLGLVIGLVVSFTVFGGIIAQTPLTLLINFWGWRISLEILGVFGLLMLLLIYLNVQDSPPIYHESNSKKESATFSQLFTMLKLTLMNKQNCLVGCCLCLINLPIFLLGALWGTLYLSQGLGFSSTHATYITSMIYVGMILGSPIIGWISDKMGLRKLPIILFITLALIFIVMLITVSTWSFPSLMLLFFAMGFVVSAQVIGYPLIAESNSPTLIGTAESIVVTIGFIGGLTQLLFAKVLESQWDHKMSGGIPVYSLHDFNRALMIIVVAFVLGLILALFIKETHCKMQHNE